MRPFTIRWLLGSLAAVIVFVASPQVQVSTLYHLSMLSILVGLTNAAVPQLSSMLSFSRTMLTVGLVTLAANAFLFHLLTRYNFGLAIASFQSLVVTALAVTALSWIMALAFLNIKQ